MTAPNHVIGGFVFTGIFSAILDVNVISSPLLIGVCVFASLLPDIDHPSTIIGRVIPFLSRWINERYGHRTITHSLLFVLVSTVVVSFINSFLLIDGLVLVFFLGIFSHVLFDMMTVSGVLFLYPFSKLLFVMPDNPSYRFRVNDRSSEMMIMAFFLVSGVSMKPLLDTGFWTQYNSLFGTIEHLRSEFNKSDDLLYVDIQVKNGSKLYSKSGYVIGFQKDQVYVIDSISLFRIPSEVERIVSIDMSHSGLGYSLDELTPSVDVSDKFLIGVIDSNNVLYDYIHGSALPELDPISRRGYFLNIY